MKKRNVKNLGISDVLHILQLFSLMKKGLFIDHAMKHFLFPYFAKKCIGFVKKCTGLPFADQNWGREKKKGTVIYHSLAQQIPCWILGFYVTYNPCF